MSITSLKGKYFQKEILAVAGISKQAYHKHWKRESEKRELDSIVLQSVRAARGRWQYKKMGGRPLYYALQIKGMGINRFEQLLSQNELTVVQKRRRVKTTQGVHEDQDINHVKGLEIRSINAVIVGDITYFFVREKLYYIFTLKDAYSKMIVGLYGSETMRAESAQRCLKQAQRFRGKESLKGCIHHSDAGSQYKSFLYRNTAKYIVWSIAENCLENGMAEQLNYIVKNHYLDNEKINNVNQLNQFLRKVKVFINQGRPVKELGYKTPEQFEKEIESISVDHRVPFRFSSFEEHGKRDFEGGISVKES